MQKCTKIVKNFWGQMSGGGGQALVSRWGRTLDVGGLTKFLPTGGTPSPREKTLGDYRLYYII